MHLREWLNGNPAVTAVAMVVVVVGAIWFCVGAMRSGPPDTSRAFFTTDDGKTWFADRSDNVPPFEKNGAIAYRCSVYECNGKQFVLQLERYDEKTAEAMRQIQGKKPNAAGSGATAQKGGINPAAGLQLKAPGEKEWHGLMDRAAMQRASAAIKCGAGYATPVTP